MNSGRFSKTAAYVAIKFYGLTQIELYRKLFDEEVITFYDRIVAALPLPLKRYHSFLKQGWFRSVCIFLEESLLPGDLMHILMRKFYISSSIDRLITQGYSQIIILGAGFDHIGVTYSRKGISCLELDTASVIEIKQHFLELHAYSNSKLNSYPVNINRTGLSDLLPGIPSIDPDARTIVIAEGFFDYLTPQKCSETLNALTHYFRSDLKFISTVFSLEQLTSFHAFVFENAVKAVGEKLQLHASIEEFRNILMKNNFQIKHILQNNEMYNENNVLKNSNLAILPGFYLLEAGKSK